MSTAPRPATDYDVVVVGSGVAGLATALGLSGLRRVALVTSGPLGSGSTVWAQGGLAAAIDAGDTSAEHAADTLTAGAGFGDATAVRVLTDAAPVSVADLLRLGARLDRAADGRLSRTREGGHGRHRVVHAGGDASGAEVSRVLVAAVGRSDVDIHTRTTVRDLLTVQTAAGRRVVGLVVRTADGSRAELRARAVVLATGGVGGLFRTTTNPPEVVGAGLGLALRAGATLADLEFVQFHPTALDVGSPSGQVPLVSEAVRGEGGVLVDARGDRVMAGRHPLADLAPRDVVARRIDEVMTAGGRVWLDTTGVPDVARRFPTIVAACRAHGVDPATEAIPVAPTQHFLCGGIRTDEWGATDVGGLYAVGEVAATGVHGANRLASNSLVEGLVFGRRVATRLGLDLAGQTRACGEPAILRPAVATASFPEIRRVLSRDAGIRRTGAGLDRAGSELAALARLASSPVGEADAGDEWLAALAIVAAAGERRESRGCHYRTDHPAASEWWRRRVVVRLGADGLPVATTTDPVDTGELEWTA
jgi:L-aspartate oxidase